MLWHENILLKDSKINTATWLKTGSKGKKETHSLHVPFGEFVVVVYNDVCVLCVVGGGEGAYVLLHLASSPVTVISKVVRQPKFQDLATF